MYDDLRRRFGNDYTAAFSSQSAARVVEFYKPDSVNRMHLRRPGRPRSERTARIFRGSVLSALARGALPAELFFRLTFRSLAKRDYDHSTAQVPDIISIDEGKARLVLAIERFDRAGGRFETGAGVYEVHQVDGTWYIAEVWAFETLEALQPELGGFGFSRATS